MPASQNLFKTISMKQFNHSKYAFILLIAFIPFLFSSCFFNKKTMWVEFDEIKDLKRINYVESSKPIERKSPIYSIENNYVKEIDPTGKATYSVYVTINKSKASFGIEDEFYIVADQHEIKKQIKNKESKDFERIKPRTRNILTADSTNLSVVTGYKRTSYSKEQFLITLSDEEIEKIKNCTRLKYRYYAGYRQATIDLDSNELIDLKYFISANQ